MVGFFLSREENKTCHYQLPQHILVANLIVWVLHNYII